MAFLRALCGTIVFVGAVALASPSSAGERELRAFVTDVVTRSPSLQAGALRRDAARQEASAAGLWPDPSLSVMLDNVPERTGGDMPMARYQLSQMVPWPGKLGFMRAAAERQGDAAAAALEVRRLDLVLDAERGYLMLLLNQRSREVNLASQELSGTITSATLARYASGNGGHHEVARSQVEESALEVEKLDLEGERVSIVAMLNALRNLPPSTPIADPGSLETPSAAVVPAKLAERAVRQRPEIAVMRAMQRESESMGALARRERYPDLMTSVWYNQVFSGLDSGGVMLGVTLPLFNVTRQSRLASAADARAAGARADIIAMEAMIRFEVADAVQKVATATRELDLLRSMALPRVRQSLESSLAAYAVGNANVVELLDARRSLQAIELALVRAQVRREIALAELERAVGGRGTGGKP